MEEAGVEMGRDRMFDTLRERGLLAPPPHRQWAQTTRRDLSLPVFRNEIEGLEVKRSNEAWVTDLTYVRTDAGFLYVSLITDKCSRKTVGYRADPLIQTSAVEPNPDLFRPKEPVNLDGPIAGKPSEPKAVPAPSPLASPPKPSVGEESTTSRLLDAKRRAAERAKKK